MNERIKKLYDQAMEPNGIEGLGGSYYDLNPEKFAELIVRECGNYLMSDEFIGRSDLDWSIILNDRFGVKQ